MVHGEGRDPPTSGAEAPSLCSELPVREWWGRMDLNHRLPRRARSSFAEVQPREMVRGVGIEPTISGVITPGGLPLSQLRAVSQRVEPPRVGVGLSMSSEDVHAQGLATRPEGVKDHDNG